MSGRKWIPSAGQTVPEQIPVVSAESTKQSVPESTRKGDRRDADAPILNASMGLKNRKQF